MASLAFTGWQGSTESDDLQVLSGIAFINRNGLLWKDAANGYGPHKTLYHRWQRWGERGIFAQMWVWLPRRTMLPGSTNGRFGDSAPKR